VPAAGPSPADEAAPAEAVAAVPASGDGLPEDAAGAACANCGSAVLRAFCADCGQRVRAEPITVRGLARDVVTRVLSLDGAFARTLCYAVTDPGGLAHAYVHGRRKPYVHPLVFFALAVAAQLLAMASFGSEAVIAYMTEVNHLVMDAYVQAGVFEEGQLAKNIEALGFESEEAYVTSMWSTVKAVNSYLLILQAVCAAVALRVLAGSRYTLGETATMAVWAYAAAVWCGVALLFVVVPVWGFMALMPATMTLMAAYMGYAGYRFYGGSWTHAALGALSYGIGFVLFVLAVLALSVVAGLVAFIVAFVYFKVL
jgi:hypothetical protein